MTVYKLEMIKIDRKTLIQCINDKSEVIYDGTNYLPQAYILRRVNDTWIHSAELKDLNANSIVLALIERVETT